LPANRRRLSAKSSCPRLPNWKTPQNVPKPARPRLTAAADPGDVVGEHRGCDLGIRRGPGPAAELLEPWKD
jgi:hypothetical protein